MQLPLLHTRLLPQPVPFGDWPDSLHWPAPAAHEIFPCRHAFPATGEQAAPSSQAMQLPLLQTLFVPQDFPLGAAPVSVHWDVPVAQVVLPSLQSEGSQSAFGVQAVQAPLLQTCPVPQALPLAAFPVTLHCEVPLSQVVVPSLQGSVVAHATLGVQGTQAPFPQTMFLPQLVPFETLLPLSMH